MRKILSTALAAASASIVLASGATRDALAADMSVKAPVYKAAPVVPSSWTGLYFGLGVGFRAADVNAQLDAATQSGPGFNFSLLACNANIACANGVSPGATSFRFSPYLGYNWQVSPVWVVGIEGDWGWGDKTTTFGGMTFPATALVSGNATDTFGVRTTWDASLRGRVGYLVNPAVLLYATGGVAWLHIEEQSNCGPGSCAPGGTVPTVISQSANKVGWTVGGGIEGALWGNWIARAEYRYADFGHVSFADVRTCPASFCGITVSQSTVTDVGVKTHTATFGLAYKLGDPVNGAASAAPLPVTATWTGGYFGGGIGARGTDASVNISSAVFNPVGAPPINELGPFLCGIPCLSGEPFNTAMFRGDVFGGYNFQVAPRWIVGAEGDLGLANRTSTFAFSYIPGFNLANVRDGSSFDLKTSWDASARARFGYVVTPAMLFYLTGGAAWQHVETSSNCSTIVNPAFITPGTCASGGASNPLTPAVIAHSDTRLGWTAGAGIEYLLTSNWFARGEYRYADYGDVTVTDVRTCAAPCRLFALAGGNETVSYDVRLRTHTATLGIAYKFGESVVTAKY